MSERLHAARPLLFVLAALGLSQLIIWTLFDPPYGYDPCGEDAPPGQPAELREFRFPAFALTLLVWAYAVFNLLEWSRAARARRGGPDKPTINAIALAVLCGLAAIGLGADTLNVEGSDVGGLGLALILWSFVSVIPIAIVGLALIAFVISALGPRDRWRSWLDRTGPVALGAVSLIAIPVIYGFVLARGGDVTLC